jgi:predicted DsbA family dithiol-disulfide isomerase
VVERLFLDFFIDGRDIGDRAVLIEAARACGMDSAVVADLLERGADADEVREEMASAQDLGVTGVPFFIFDGKFAVPGAQPPDVLQRMIAKAIQAPQPEG